MCVLQTLCKAVGLHLQDQLAALPAGVIACGDERRGGDAARQIEPVQRQIKLHARVAVAADREARIAAAFRAHTPQIQLRAGAAGAEGLAFCDQRAVLTDEIVRGKDHIRRRFAVAGTCVEICAQKPRRLLRDERAAIVRLSGDLVAGGKIGDHGRARERMTGARRQRRPEILADLCGQHEFRHVLQRKSSFVPNRVS